MTRFGVLQFPGSCDERDAVLACERVAGAQAELLWHGERDLKGVDAIVVPGGFSYGDYLRVGAIARFSPVMEAVAEFAAAGGPVLGICNGFQVLCEAGLLPGALTRNTALHFVNRPVRLRVESTATAWTGDYAPGQEITIVIKNGEGCYVADEATLDRLEADGRVVVRYLPGPDGRGNPNGSLRDIAGISNAAGTVVGLMPHPEHSVEALTGAGTDGRGFFSSVLTALLATA